MNCGHATILLNSLPWSTKKTIPIGALEKLNAQQDHDVVREHFQAKVAANEAQIRANAQLVLLVAEFSPPSDFWDGAF